jgi:hypothetical protein
MQLVQGYSPLASRPAHRPVRRRDRCVLARCRSRSCTGSAARRWWPSGWP